MWRVNCVIGIIRLEMCDMCQIWLYCIILSLNGKCIGMNSIIHIKNLMKEEKKKLFKQWRQSPSQSRNRSSDWSIIIPAGPFSWITGRSFLKNLFSLFSFFGSSIQSESKNCLTAWLRARGLKVHQLPVDLYSFYSLQEQSPRVNIYCPSLTASAWVKVDFKCLLFINNSTITEQRDVLTVQVWFIFGTGYTLRSKLNEG